MIRRYFFLTLTLVCLYLTSLLLQSSITQPAETISKAANFTEVKSEVCLRDKAGDRWVAVIQGGALPAGSVGIIAAKVEKLIPGDCFQARIQLSRISGFSRYAFQGKVREILGRIKHDSRLAVFNKFRSFARSFHGDSKNLVAGLSAGIDDGLSQQLLESMKATGLTHLTAVSGANCAIVLGLVWLILRRLKVGRGIRFLISEIALFGYVLLVGYQASVLRAAFMMSVVLFAFEFGRRVWVPAALGLGSVVLLIIDPWLVIDYGFWLSVLATLGLVLLTPRISEYLESKMPKPIALGLAATVSAQLWCLPLLIQLQGGFTTYSVLANLLVEPCVPIITVLGLLGTVAGPFVPPIGNACFTFAGIPAGWIVWVANSLSEDPMALINIPTGALALTLASVLVIALSVFIVKKRYWALLTSVAVMLIALGAVTLKVSRTWPIQNWNIIGCDVGQGDALVIKSERQIALIDVGKDPKLIDDCLDRIGVTQIDLLVLTHFDFDHVGGVTGALAGRKVREALISPFPDNRPEANFIRATLDANVLQVIAPTPGISGTLGKFDWQVFSSLGSSAKTANQGSLGIKFESKEEVIYTLADLDETAQCQALAWAHPSSKPTVVKVSHHGSSDQCANFYSQIQPDVALISVGKGNPYGHPTASALSLLARLGVNTFRTDTQGAVSLNVSNGVVHVLVAGSR